MLNTTTEDRKFSAFIVDHLCSPLPCVLCGRYPSEGEKALERNTGEPRLLCADCVQTACVGFEDLDRIASGCPSIVGL